MSNILTVPVSGAIYFSDGVAGSSTIPNLSAGVALRYDNSAGLNITSFASAASASDRFSIDGASGRLFSVSDSLTGSIFSVNDAAGLPIIEVESNLIDRITMGTYGSNALVVNDTKVGIGTATPAEKLSVVGGVSATGGFFGPGITVSNFPTAGLLLNYAGSGAGASYIDFFTSGSHGGQAAARFRSSNISGGTGFLLGRNGFFGWNEQSYAGQEDVGTGIMRDSFGVIAQRNGTSPQELRIYKSFTDASNYERFYISTNVGSTSATQIGLSAAGTGQNRNLEVVTGGSTRMTVTSAGNVGVATTVPSYLFSVKPNSAHVGQIGFRTFLAGGASPALYLEDYSGTVTYKFGQDNSGVLKIASNTDAVCFDTTGNYTSLYGNGTLVQAGNSTVTIQGNNARILLDAYTTNAIQFFSGSTATERMRILGSNGNVGIGTTTPNERLTVSGNISSSNVVYALGGNSDQWNSTYATVSSLSANNILDGGNTKGTNLLIGTNDNFNLNLETAGSTRMTVTSSGNVGIGTTTPGYKLDVNGTSRLGGNVIVDGDSLTMASAGWVQTWGLSYSGPTTHRLSSNYDLELIGGSGTRGVTIKNSIVETARFTDGRVGIGTMTPVARLDIADTTLAGSGALSGSALSIAQTWNTTGNPTAIKLNVTNTASGAASNLLDLQVGTVSMFKVAKSGSITTPAIVGGLGDHSLQFIFGGNRSVMLGIGELRVSGTSTIGWSGNGTHADATAADLILVRDAANTLAQRRGVSPQAFRLYNTFTDTVSAFERLNIKWDANVIKIGTEKGIIGGLGRAMEFQTDGTTRMTVTSSGNVGIGTTNPTTILHLRGGVSPTLKIEGFDAGATYLYPAISFHSNNNQGNYESARIEGFGYHPSGFNNLNFFISNTSGALSRMWQMDSSGNIVQNPGAFSADMPGSGIIFTSAATGGTGFRTIKITACASTGHPGESLRLQAGDANYAATGGLNFGGKIFVYGGKAVTANSTPKDGDVILAHDGTSAIGGVGVGTSTPTARLDIADTTFAGSSALSGSALNITQTWNTTGNPTAITLNVTNSASGSTSNLLNLQVGGASKFSVNKNGVAQFSGGSSRAVLFDANGGIGVNRADVSMTTALVFLGYNTAPRITIVRDGTIGWSPSQSDTSGGNATPDTVLLRDGAANILGLRNGVNPQAFRVYSTYTDASNYERFFINTNVGATSATQIGLSAAGTGQNRNLEFVTGGSTRMTLPATGGISLPNGSDISFGGAFNLYGTTSGTTLNGPTAFGQVGVSINGVDKWIFKYDGLLCGGGTTASFPAIKRSGAALQVRLADDSGYAALETAGVTCTGTVSAAGDFAVATSLQGVILVSPNSTRWRITVNDNGSLQTTAL